METNMKKLLVPFVTALVAALVSPTSSTAADDTFTIPAGTNLQVRLTTTLSTRTNQNGDPWTGNVVEPVFAKGQEVIPSGSRVEGRVSLVRPPGRAKGVAEMRLVPERITTPDDTKFAISAGLEDVQGAPGAKIAGEEGTIKGPGKSKKGAAKETGVETGVGAGVGAIAAGGTGALYGAVIGAAAGGLHTLLKRHKDIVLPQGTELTLVINRDTTYKKAASTPDTQK
jgi:hypothetical protein